MIQVAWHGLQIYNCMSFIAVNRIKYKLTISTTWLILNGSNGHQHREFVNRKTMPLNTALRERLIELAPFGTLVTRKWLVKKGIPIHSLDNLVKSEQLVPLVPGVYKRPETVLTWQGVVCSLQRMGSDLVVGGLTALEEHGLAHYLSLSSRKTIHLFGYDKMPSWVNKLGVNLSFHNHGNSRLWGTCEDQKMQSNAFTVVLPWSDLLIPMRVSTPERAMCEVLMDVPKKISFEHADQLMQGMPNLHPRRLSELLQRIKNVKVKRLFLWLAERHNHAWLKKLEMDNIDLGSGKRVLVKNGTLNKKYRITVPDEMNG